MAQRGLTPKKGDKYNDYISINATSPHPVPDVLLVGLR